MILDPYEVGFYAPANQMLVAAWRRDLQELIDDWQDEASQAAIDNRPEKTRYIEYMIGRLYG